MATLMITGAAGKIGTALRERFGEHTLRLTDIRPLPTPVAANETFVQADLADEGTLAELAGGADLVVHLGGLLVGASFTDTAAANIMGTYHVLEATRAAGVQRVFYASSNHAVGYTPVADIDDGAPLTTMPIRPDGDYGVTKAAAEALCSLYADDHGLAILSARILTFAPAPRSLRELATWISPDDTARLVLAALSLDGPGVSTCWGVSRNTRGWASLREGEALGYFPEDDSEPWAESIVPTATEDDRKNTIAIGGRSAPYSRADDRHHTGAHR